MLKRIFVSFVTVLIIALFFLDNQKQYAATTTSPIKTVFIILMENHNWADIKANSPYLVYTLLPMSSHAEQYYNPPGNHPSLPNYLWLEAGTNFGIKNDDLPSVHHQSTKNHLVALLQAKGIAWKSYQEDISGTDCPLIPVNNYIPRHNPFVYFDDVTDTNNPQSQNCIQHVRPYTELTTDLESNAVSGYNFITPNICNDSHNCSIATGDTWLSKQVPKILNSQAYKDGGALFITYDEGEDNKDGPIGMVIVSPFAKKNYSNSIQYTHSSTLKTIEEIFGVTPLLGNAAHTTDLSDFFTIPLSKNAPSVKTVLSPIPKVHTPSFLQSVVAFFKRVL